MKRSLVLLSLLVLAPAAYADVVVTGTEVARDRSGRSQGEKPRTVYISPRGVRVDSENVSHILDARNGLMLEVDHGKQTARVMTFKQLGEMTEAARKAADEAVDRAKRELGAMPPKVRAQVEEAIRLQHLATQARKPGAYQRAPTGQKRNVNGFDCEDVKETLNGEHVGTSCVHKGVKLPEADRKMLQKLARDMEAAGVSNESDGFTRAFLDGIPVEMASRDPRTGELRVEERVTRIEHRAVPDALFEPPANYRLQTWDGAGPKGTGDKHQHDKH